MILDKVYSPLILHCTAHFLEGIESTEKSKQIKGPMWTDKTMEVTLMEQKNLKLDPVDQIEIVTLMDNYSDVLLQSEGPVTFTPHYSG